MPQKDYYFGETKKKSIQKQKCLLTIQSKDLESNKCSLKTSKSSLFNKSSLQSWSLQLMDPIIQAFCNRALSSGSMFLLLQFITRLRSTAKRNTELLIPGV